MKDNNDSRLSHEDKQKLRDRILKSAIEVRKLNRKRTYKEVLVYSVAASLAIIFGLHQLIQFNKEPSIEEFVNTVPTFDAEGSNQVTIVLGNSEIGLDSDETSIQYSSSGTKVNIGDKRAVQQKTKNDKKIVFNTLIVPFGKQAQLTLSDGSRVWINSGSRLIYPAAFNEEKREVFLQGEAIFEVQHNKDKQFRVHSDHQEIEVLGTVFNVSAYSGEMVNHTVLKSGSVRLTSKSKNRQSVTIIPGTMSAYDQKTDEFSQEKVDPDDYFSWREGYLTLKNEKMGSIFKKLSRYYNVTIEFEKDVVAGKTFSGRLDLQEDIEGVLDLISTTNFTFEREDDTIFINPTK